MHPYEILRRPVITEKNTNLQSQNKYTFEIPKEARKQQIKEAVEKAFKVTVTAVNVIRVPGKTRRIGRRIIATPPWKKAVVTVKPGDRIEFFESV